MSPATSARATPPPPGSDRPELLTPAERLKEQARVLRTALLIAVPKWVTQLCSLPFAELQERAHACGEYLRNGGDEDLLYGGPRCAEAFNRLAEGMACASFCPGGINAFGLRFQALHPEAEHECEACGGRGGEQRPGYWVVCSTCRGRGQVAP